MYSQGMLAGVAVLYNKIDNFEVIEDERVRPVCLCGCRIRSQCQSRKHGRDEGHVVSLLVEHGSVGAVVQSVEDDLKLDSASGREYGDEIDRDQVKVGNVVEVVNADFSKVGDGGGFVVGDGSGDVWDTISDYAESMQSKTAYSG